MSRELVFKIREVKIKDIAHFFFLNRKGLKIYSFKSQRYIHFPEINKLYILRWLSRLRGCKFFVSFCLLLLFWVSQLFNFCINMCIYTYGFKVIGKFFCCDICDVYDYEYYYHSFFLFFLCDVCVVWYYNDYGRLGRFSPPFLCTNTVSGLLHTIVLTLFYT